MSYRIIIAKSVQKQIDKLPNSVRDRAIPKLQALSDNPRPAGAVKLKGYENQYRIRVGDYRILYEIDETAIAIKLLQCKHRKDVYKNKE